MTVTVFPASALAALDVAYPSKPLKLNHALVSHPLLTLPALERLATALPAGSVEYNAGDLPIGVRPEDIPENRLGIADTIRAIDRCGSWMVLKRIEQHPDYARLLHDVLGELTPITEPRTGRMHQCEGFIFLSSPASVTPFHFDPEHNILLQVSGTKTMTVFPADDEDLAGAAIHEAFHLGQHHRNLPWQDEFTGRGLEITLTPGDAIHVPVKSPHWVKNHEAVSISLSVTWRSDWSVAEADARAFNHVARGIGLNPRRPAAFPARNLAKSLAYRAIRRLRGPTRP